jgi:hypothetical protein
VSATCVLGHDDVSQDDKLISFSNLLQYLEKQIASPDTAQHWPLLATAAGDEV